MIKITLEFPNMDQAIEALSKMKSADGKSPAPATVEKVEAPKPVKPAATPAAAKSTPAPATTAAATASPSETGPAPASSVDYPTLQKAVFALAGKSRESAAAVAQSFGVKTFKELPEARWTEALAAVKTAMADLTKPEAA